MSCSAVASASARASAGGVYVSPAIVRIGSDAPILQTETFAPILYVMPYDTLEEAIALQNRRPAGPVLGDLHGVDA